MQRHVVQALAQATVLLLTVPAGAERAVSLYPCLTLVRLGTMDGNGVVTRPTTPRQLAINISRNCVYVVLGRFVSVSDSHYDQLIDPPEEPVFATFRVAEVLRGKAAGPASIGIARHMLVSPGKDVSRFVGRLEDDRLGLAIDLEDELKSIHDSGMPLTQGEHEDLIDAVRRMVQTPPRTRHERHQLAKSTFFTNSPLSFQSELGAIHPDELFLLGLTDENPGGPRGRYFGSIHTDLFWGQEALEIAAALRREPEANGAPQP